jgi:deazaflavin-dependent oxidoreductase (nitroreductase family)
MSETRAPSAWNGFNQDIIDQFRAHGGTIVRGQFTGRALLLLTTTGARTGRHVTSPLAYTRSGDAYVVIASKGGAPTNPDWYHNLVANPDVNVVVGAESFAARARIAEGEERERLFAAQAALMPGFADYQRKTTRQIPVVVLERVG